MSRTNKPRIGAHFKKSGGGYSYRNGHTTYAKRSGNKWARQEVNQRMKDVLFNDAFDEKELPDSKEHLFDIWWYD